MNPDHLLTVAERITAQCEQLLQTADEKTNPEARKLIEAMYHNAQQYVRLGVHPGWGSITIDFLQYINLEVRAAYVPLQGNAELLLMGAAGTLSREQHMQVEAIYDEAWQIYHWMQDYIFGKF